MSYRLATVCTALLAVAAAGLPGAAHATSVSLYSIDAGTASGAFRSSTDAVSQGSDVFFDRAWIGTSPFTAVNKSALTSTPGDIAFAYSYGFTLGSTFFANDLAGKPAAVNVQLDGRPPTQDFYLTDLTTNQTISTTVALAGSTDLALSALIPKGNTDSYSLILLVPQSVASKGTNNFTISGSVPAPGSLVMFGVFLLGLVGLSYGNKAQRGW